MLIYKQKKTKKNGEQNSGVLCRNLNWGNTNFVKVRGAITENVSLLKYKKHAKAAELNIQDAFMLLPAALRE